MLLLFLQEFNFLFNFLLSTMPQFLEISRFFARFTCFAFALKSINKHVNSTGLR